MTDGGTPTPDEQSTADEGPGTEEERLTGHAFHLHPLSIPYRILQQGVGLVVAVLVFGGPAFGAVAGALGVALAIGLAVAIGVAVVGYGVAYYRRFEYELTPDTFDIRSGVFARREREIPLRRVQNVDISQNVVQRVLGIAEVRLETAGASGAEAQLKFVGVDRASHLQREISRLSRSADGEAEGEERFETVFEITDRELGILALVSADIQFISILFVLGSMFLPAVGEVVDTEWFVGAATGFGGLLGPLTTLVAIVVLGLVYGAINATLYYGFTLHRGEEELRYDRGLLQQYSGTIPLSKVQSLTISENLLARVLGYASLDIETAGQGGGERGQASSQSAVPIATRDRVFELANSIEPVGELQFDRPPKRARQRYAVRYGAVVGLVTGLLYLVTILTDLSLFWWAPLGALLLVPIAAHLKWRHRGYAVAEDHVVTRNGFWVRRTKVVPYYRIQTVLSSETVFQRRRRLGTVTIDTAGTRSLLGNEAEAVDVDVETTDRLRERVATELYASLRKHRHGPSTRP